MHWLWFTRDKLPAHLGAGTLRELGVHLQGREETKDGVAQRGCGHALFKTMQLMGTVNQRNDPKGDQKLNFTTLA